MAHRNSPQADALKPGEEAAEFPRRGGGAARGGLAAFGDDGDDLMPALARKIVSRDEDDAELVEVAIRWRRGTPSRVYGPAPEPRGP